MQMNKALDAARQRYADFQKHRKAFHPGARSWYSMEMKDDTAEIFIYDAIGFFGVEVEDFIRDLQKVEAKEITLRINSPGGDVFGGTAIYNALLRHPAKVHTKIDGLAASMASVIALAGDTVEMAENAFFMIHKPWTFMLGNADDLRKEAEVLDKIEGSAVSIYAKSGDLSEQEIRTAMAEETWYSAEEAKDAGFIDSIFTGKDEKSAFDLSVFAHAPEGLAANGGNKRDVSPKELEAVLREAGLSQSEAKGLLAKGIKALRDQREVGSGDRPNQREVEDGDLDDTVKRVQRLAEQITA